MSQNNFNPTLRLIVYQKMSDALNEAYKCLNQHPEPAFRQDIEALSNLANNLLGYLCVAVLDQNEKVVDLDVEFPCSFLIETVNTIAGKKDMKDFLPLLAEARNDFAQNLKAAEAVLSPEDQEELKRLTYAMKVAGILSPDEDSEEDEEDAEGESFLKALLSRVKGAIVIMGHSPDDDDDEDDDEDNDEDNESEN